MISGDTQSFTQQPSEQRVWFLPCANTQLGQAVAEEALRDGDKVIVATSKSLNAEVISSETENCMIVDIYDHDSGALNKQSCIDAVIGAIDRFNRIDIMVTCSSTVHVGYIEEIEEWQLIDQFKKNFEIVVELTESIIPLFKSQGFGHIINITDSTSISGTPGLGLLSSSMKAIEGYSESIALTESANGIKVSTVQVANEVTLITNPNIFSAVRNNKYDTKPRDLIQHATKFPEEQFCDAVIGVLAIGGVKNPPARLFAGLEVVDLVREKISIASEELDDFSQVPQVSTSG